MANVAMVVTNPCSPDPRVERHARWLFELGHDVKIFAWDRFGCYPKLEIKEGYKIIRKGPHITKSSSNYQIWKRKNKFLKKLNLKCDLLILNDSDTYGIRFSGKTVLDMHDLSHGWPLMSGNSIINKIASSIMLWQCKKLMNNSDLILSSSPGIGKWIKSQGYESNVIMNYRNSVNKDKNIHCKAIGYFGRIRDFDSMLKLKSSADKIGYRVIIAGDGPAANRVHEEIDGIDYRGHFDENDLENLMKEISVMYAVYPPSRLNIKHGAISVKMLDAAAFGIPSVVSKDNPMAEFCVSNSIGIAVDYDCIDDISQGIEAASNIEITKKFSEDRVAFVKSINSLDF